MKFRLLEFLADPVTGDRLQIDVFSTRENPVETVFAEVRCGRLCHWKNSPVQSVDPTSCSACHRHEIIDAKLFCPTSGAEYPVVDGVPRMLPKDLLVPLLKSRYGSFLDRYGQRFGQSWNFDYRVESSRLRTASAFGYQWTTFKDNYGYFKEIFLSFTRPFLDEPDFRGQRLLEIGCGSGRPAVACAAMGSEVVAMDFSEAVESAYLQSLQHPLLHVVQGDAYAPPFRPAFDAAYSVGVLQHIDDPLRALQGIHRVLAPGTPLLLWVYGEREWWYRPIEWTRRLTSKLPKRAIRVLAYLLAVASEAVLLKPYRLLARWRATREFAEIIPGRIYAKYPFRENYIGWFDRLAAPVTCYFSAEAIASLLESAAFTDIRLHSRQGASASWVVFARRGDGDR